MGLIFAVCAFSQPADAATGDLTAAARFQAAEILLKNVGENLTGFVYPQVDTSDFKNSVVPQREFLRHFAETRRKVANPSESEVTQLGLFCRLDLLNVKLDVLSKIDELLLPRVPGDKPEVLRQKHAAAIAFFEEQAALAGLIAEVVPCPK